MITIYGKANCTYCEQAKTACTLRGKQFEYKQLGKDYELNELQAKSPYMKTFPQIFDGHRLIGGFNDLMTELSQA